MEKGYHSSGRGRLSLCPRLVLLVGGLGGVGYESCDSGCGVQLIAGAKVVEALAVVVFAVPDGDALRSIHRQPVSVNGDGGALIEAEAEQIGVRFDDGGEVV